MRKAILAALLVASVGISACETTGYGAAPAYGGGGPTVAGTRLSSCMRNALIGAGIGAVAGALAGSEHNRGENAALGAVVGGGGTFGVCKLLDNQQQARVEQNYQNALRNNAAITDGWVGASSRRYLLAVARPQATPGQPSCRTINATLDVNGQGPQQLPTETYCNNGAGWAPVA